MFYKLNRIISLIFFELNTFFVLPEHECFVDVGGYGRKLLARNVGNVNGREIDVGEVF